MKSRFSSQFVSKIEKSMTTLGTIQYDIDAMKMDQ